MAGPVLGRHLACDYCEDISCFPLPHTEIRRTAPGRGLSYECQKARRLQRPVRRAGHADGGESAADGAVL